MTEPTSDATLLLPAELAPTLAERVLRLVAEVGTTTAPDLVIEVRPGRRCVVCHQAGKLGGHHDASGRIQWIHRSCHRRLHAAGATR